MQPNMTNSTTTTTVTNFLFIVLFTYNEKKTQTQNPSNKDLAFKYIRGTFFQNHFD